MRMLNGLTRPDEAHINEIKVVELNRFNFDEIWPYLRARIRTSSLIAVDLELSGLGRGINDKNIAARYSALRSAASTRSVISLGLATFRFKSMSKKKRKLKFDVEVFNILTMKADAYTVEPSAMEFLLSHSFDFNRLVKEGVIYQPLERSDKPCVIRKLVREILSASATICFHNGVVDLTFLYHNFYAPLPEDFVVFVNSVTELFPIDQLPICDSKYLAEYQTRMKASYLEYVFRRCQGDNAIEQLNQRVFLSVRFLDVNGRKQAILDATDVVDCRLPARFPVAAPGFVMQHLCPTFSNHGRCHSHERGICQRLHSIDFVIDAHRQKERKIRKKRQRRYKNANGACPRVSKQSEEDDDDDDEDDNDVDMKDEAELSRLKKELKLKSSGCHRAGVDAFMTGFAVLFQQRMHIFNTGSACPEHLNRLPLSGKPDPLVLRKSISMSQVCPEHSLQFLAIQQQRRRSE